MNPKICISGVAFAFLVTLLMVTSCTKSSPDTPNNDVVTTGPTYHGAVRTIVEKNCTTCHQEGGIGPFALTSFELVRDMAELLNASVIAGRMPPWMPADDCYPLADHRSLSGEELAALEEWIAAGKPEGNPDDYVPPEMGPIGPSGDPDMMLDAGVDYIPDETKPDDYRCLPLPHTFEEDTYLVSSWVFPDQSELVHHVLLYLVPDYDIAGMEGLDAAEEGPGYTCFGGPSVGTGETVGGWVPGTVPRVFPEDMAIRIPAGSRIVMQMHYNVLNYEGTPPPDRTKVGLWTLPSGTTPEYLVEILPYPHLGIEIPPHEASWTESQDFPVPDGGRIIAVTPHMHTLGREIRVDLLDGDESQCLINIPDWDFNWQQAYGFPEDSYIHTEADHMVRLTCTYDNSVENQPVVNGEQQDPKLVTWGDGTRDEMCLAYLAVALPYYDPVAVCAGSEDCVHGCEDGTCFLACAINAGIDCAQCVTMPLAACSAPICPTELGAVSTCIAACDNPQTCLFASCNDEYNALYTCMRPHIVDGTCDSDLESCGLSFGEEP
ncbi:MAG: hypothetical protein CMH54_06655 [Myxococcales bacterium]|nr:hypothetical protein [Myxococcales bacterium]